MVVLTEDLVLAKTRLKTLSEVRNLNLWGQDLSDVSIIARMPSAEVLSLSVNKIATLKDFAACGQLQELYLRKNEVGDVAEVQHLAQLPNLRVLWLSDNPCAEAANYRQLVISALPRLQKLDNVDITREERSAVVSSGIRLPPATAASTAPSAVVYSPSNVQSQADRDSMAVAAGGMHGVPERAGPSEGAQNRTLYSGARGGDEYCGTDGRKEMPGAEAAAVGLQGLQGLGGRVAGGPGVGLGGVGVSGAAAPNGVGAAPSRSRANLLYAVLVLVDEMAQSRDVESIRMVQKECESRLAGFL